MNKTKIAIEIFKMLSKLCIAILSIIGMLNIWADFLSDTEEVKVLMCERQLQENFANDALQGRFFDRRDFPAGTTDINKVGKGWYTFKHSGQCMLFYDVPSASALTKIKECKDGY